MEQEKGTNDGGNGTYFFLHRASRSTLILTLITCCTCCLYRGILLLSV